MKTQTSLTLLPVTMLIIGAIDSIRNLPSAALFGTSLVCFFVISAILFLLPIAFVSAELSATWPESPGVFGWLNKAFGEKIAVAGVWLQWINTLVWFPTILSFLAGTLAYLINPSLADSPVYLVTVILIAFWSFTLLNFKGIETSARVAAVCTLVGMVLPIASVIVLGGLWLIMGWPMAIEFKAAAWLPSVSIHQHWSSITAIMTSFVGIELVAVHVNHVENPHSVFPKAIFIAVVTILISMILGALAIAMVIPSQEMSLVGGTMQALLVFLNAFHLGWLIKVYALMVFVGTMGGLVNWLISPAKGLHQISESHYLPRYFSQLNANGTPQRILVLQGLIVSIICMSFIILPSVNASYWFMTDLSTELYMLLYGLIFLAAITLRHRYPNRTSAFQIGSGLAPIYLIAGTGFLGVSLTLLVGFFPPAGIQTGDTFHYELLFAGAMLLFMSPIGLLWWYQRKKCSVDGISLAKQT